MSPIKPAGKDIFIELLGIASSADELVRMARDLRPDIVVSDNRMPNPDDGIRAIKEIKAVLPDVACVLWSNDDPKSLPAFPGEFVDKSDIFALRDVIVRAAAR